MNVATMKLKLESIEYRLTSLEAAAKPQLETPPKTSEKHSNSILEYLGIAFITNTLSDALDHNLTSSEHDSFLKSLGYEIDPTPDGRHRVARELHERTMELVDKAVNVAQGKRNKTETLEQTDGRFDFAKKAYEKLLKKAGESRALTKREYYRACGLMFCLRKEEARQLLNQLEERFKIEIKNDVISFN